MTRDSLPPFDPSAFWRKIQAVFRQAGEELTFNALVLFYALQKNTVPRWAKVTIIGALVYFISPIDAIPDMLIPLGFSDDLGVILSAIGLVAREIDDVVKEQATVKTRQWFGDQR